MEEGESKPIQERQNESRWGYDTRFKYYLYRVGIAGNEGVESIKNFPERIELNNAWHTGLNRMKAESMDGRERWAPIGMKKDRLMDFVPETFIKGSYTHVVFLTRKEVEEKYGIVHHIGRIHTHPSDWFNSLGVKLIVSTRLVKDYEGFSSADLYGIVNGNGLPISTVVEKHHNYFVFRTAETEDLPADSPLRPQVSFQKHWDRKYGGRYFGKNGEVFWASPQYSLSKMNRGIAEEYSLALYKGKPGEDLIREFP